MSTPKQQRLKTKSIQNPDYLLAALEANPKAKEYFECKSNSFHKEYVIWINNTNKKETRQIRIRKALAGIAEGKCRFQKHQK